MELSDRLLKLIQVVEEKDGRRVAFLGVSELDTQEEEKQLEGLLSLLKQLPHHTPHIFASISRSQITTRMFALPSTNPPELTKMVEFQIEKEIPFPKEKIIFDSHVIETTPEGYSKVLLVIAGEEMIRRSLELLRRAGVDPESLFFSSQGLASWFALTHGEKEKENFSALVDIDLFLTHVEILHQGEIHFTRSFMIGSREIDEKGEETVEGNFLQELSRTFAAFKKEAPPGRIDKVFLSGVSKVLPLIQRVASSRLEYPFETIAFKDYCPVDPRSVKGTVAEEISFSSAAGFLLKDEARINLIPPAEKRARRERLFRRALVQCALLAVGSLALFGFLFGNTLYHRRETLTALQKELRKLEPAATEIESMQKQLESLRIRKGESEMSLELLRELYRLIPPEASLSYLAIEPRRISLRGNTQALSTVFSFAKALESSSFFTSVRVKNATRRTLSEGEMTIFQIDATVAMDPKGKKGKK